MSNISQAASAVSRPGRYDADNPGSHPPIQLYFHGPYPLCSSTADTLADCPHRVESGVCLWAVPHLTDQCRVTYVGASAISFYHRMEEHPIQTLGGNYRVINMFLASKALLDRITDRAHIIETGTESFRFRRTMERRKK